MNNEKEEKDIHNENSHIVTTTIGDFILRWGLFGVATILILGAAQNAKDFEKLRVKTIGNVKEKIEQNMEQTLIECDRNFEKFFTGDEKKDLIIKKHLQELKNSGYKLNSKELKRYFEVQPEEIYYQIKLCEKYYDFYSKIGDI